MVYWVPEASYSRERNKLKKVTELVCAHVVLKVRILSFSCKALKVTKARQINEQQTAYTVSIKTFMKDSYHIIEEFA